MSKYYQVKGIGKVRVSDHEANTALNGSNDINLYIVDACGSLLSVESQIENICDKRDLDITIFKDVISDFKEGSYDKNFFKTIEDESEEEYSNNNSLKELRDMISDKRRNALEGHYLILNTTSTKEGRAEIKALSELTGISQSQIKKHFNIR